MESLIYQKVSSNRYVPIAIALAPKAHKAMHCVERTALWEGPSPTQHRTRISCRIISHYRPLQRMRQAHWPCRPQTGLRLSKLCAWPLAQAWQSTMIHRQFWFLYHICWTNSTSSSRTWPIQGLSALLSRHFESHSVLSPYLCRNRPSGAQNLVKFSWRRRRRRQLHVIELWCESRLVHISQLATFALSSDSFVATFSFCLINVMLTDINAMINYFKR